MEKEQSKSKCLLYILITAIFAGVGLFILYINTSNYQPMSKILICEPCNLNTVKKEVLPVNNAVDPQWIYEMHKWANGKGRYSQGSQDLFLEKIFSVINTTNKYFVEFGFNEQGYDRGGSGANTRKLYEEGWRGLLLDGDHENPKINLKKHYLFANNIVAIFEENNVPKELDFLSCDMDSHDFWVFRAILQAGYRPRVITTEYNSNYHINDTITLLDPSIVGNSTFMSNFRFQFSGCAWGVGVGGLRMLAESHGYTMIGIVTGLDLIWIRNDLLSMHPSNVPPFEWFFSRAGLEGLHHFPQKTPESLPLLIDYKTYVVTAGNLTASNEAARAILKKRQLACYKDVYQYI